MRSSQIAALCALVDELYVFPDVAKRVAEVLRQQDARGAYAGLDDDEEFAATVTADLQSVNADRHLRLLHSVEPIAEDDAEVFDPDEYRAEVELNAGGVAQVRRLDGNVGYLDVRLMHNAEVAGPFAVAAMNLLAHTDALIFDVRRNGGGDPGMVALYCSYLFDEPTRLNDIYQRAGDSTNQFWTLPHVPGPRFGGTKPVYVLTSAYTFSGAEELAYDLQARDRATIIGERTRGGAHPGGRHRIATHLKAAIPTGRAINPVTGTNWEGTGVVPDVELPAADAFDKAYDLALSHVVALTPDTAPRREILDEARAALDQPALDA